MEDLEIVWMCLTGLKLQQGTLERSSCCSTSTNALEQATFPPLQRRTTDNFSAAPTAFEKPLIKYNWMWISQCSKSAEFLHPDVAKLPRSQADPKRPSPGCAAARGSAGHRTGNGTLCPSCAYHSATPQPLRENTTPIAFSKWQKSQHREENQERREGRGGNFCWKSGTHQGGSRQPLTAHASHGAEQPRTRQQTSTEPNQATPPRGAAPADQTVTGDMNAKNKNYIACLQFLRHAGFVIIKSQLFCHIPCFFVLPV